MRYTQVPVSVPLVRETTGPGLLNPADAARCCADLRDLGQEAFIVLTVSQKHAIIARRVVSIGTLSESICHMRDVFRAAIEDNAARVIVAHNHPSGDPTPSHADRALTERLIASGKLLGVALLDHLVIGRDEWVSIVNGDRGRL